MGTGGLELGRSPNSSDKKRSYRDFQPYLWQLRRVLSDFMVYKLYMYSLCKCTNFRSSRKGFLVPKNGQTVISALFMVIKTCFERFLWYISYICIAYVSVKISEVVGNNFFAKNGPIEFQPYLWSLRRVLSGFYGI